MSQETAKTGFVIIASLFFFLAATAVKNGKFNTQASSGEVLVASAFVTLMIWMAS